MPNLYIISGCNGAGKTTASFTILPEILDCKEFVNADSIAIGISPFNPQSVAFEAGRIMLERIYQLINEKADFAFETTLATRSYVQLIKTARNEGYKIHLLFFWLISPDFAKQRVAERVSKGGHNIPEEVIIRRYYRGIHNLLELYIPIVDNWVIVDNMDIVPDIIAKGTETGEKMVINQEFWSIIIKQSENHGK